MGNEQSSRLNFLVYDKDFSESSGPTDTFTIDKKDLIRDIRTGFFVIDTGDAKFHCKMTGDDLFLCEDQLVFKATDKELLKSWIDQLEDQTNWSRVSVPIIFRHHLFTSFSIMRLRLDKVKKTVINTDGDSFMIVETSRGKGLMDINKEIYIPASDSAKTVFNTWFTDVNDNQ